MIDLRMVADDHGYMQLQSRVFCVQRGWTEWKSVPVVHEPKQFVDRVKVSDAKASATKPDGGLTRKQVQELLEDFGLNRDAYLKNVSTGYGERYKDHNQGLADGISKCLEAFKAKLGQQADELIDDELDSDIPY